MPAEEFYPRPIRYDLYQQDPAAQALDLMASGSREQIRQGDRYGEIKARAEENKWNAIADIPNKIGEGMKEGARMRREGERHASEESSRQLQRDQVRQQMEEQQREIALLDAPGADGKSLRQARADAERGDMAWNAGRGERYAEEQGFKRQEMSMNEKRLAAELSAQGLTRQQIAMQLDQYRQQEADRKLNVALDGIYANVDPNNPDSVAAADAQASALLSSQGSSSPYGSGLAAGAKGRAISGKQQAALASQVARQGTVPYQNMMEEQQKALGDAAAIDGLLAERNNYVAATQASITPWDNDTAKGARGRFVKTLQSVPGFEGEAADIGGMGSITEPGTFDPGARMTQKLQGLYTDKQQAWERAKMGMSPQERASPEVRQVDMRFEAIRQQLQQPAGAGNKNSINPFTGQGAPPPPAGNPGFFQKRPSAGQSG